MKLGMKREVRIIDRTLPEVYAVNSRISRLDIVKLCWMLKDLGVDLIEINPEILRKLGKLPKGIDFLYRIGRNDAGLLAIPDSIRSCIMKAKMLKDEELVKRLAEKKLDITAEFKIDNPDDLARLEKLRDYSFYKYLAGIRIKGLNGCISRDWAATLKQVGTRLGVGIDICPENNNYCATAAAVEGLMEGVDSVTATFTGYGRNRSFAALEEILASIRLLVSSEVKMNLRNLPELSSCFAKITHKAIAPSKPVIGSGIFKYEAGIHADGIEKNPLTYEPFEPDLVGRKRELSLGKHSGTGAVISKMKELGIEYSMERVGAILNNVKERSIRMGRSLFDDEIREICKYV